MNKPIFLENLKLPSRNIALHLLFITCFMLISLNHSPNRTRAEKRIRDPKNAERHLAGHPKKEDNRVWGILEGTTVVNNGITTASTLIHYGNAGCMINAGRNSKKYLKGVVWLFKNFQTILFFTQVDTKGVSSNTTSGDGSFTLKKYLIWGNAFFLLLIVSPIVLYYRATVKKLTLSKKETENENDSLTIANKELYRFVYSASHDLRSPINSVKGLVEIAREEENIHQIKDYLNLMHESLTRQDQFISDIIDYSRNKRKQKCIETISLDKLTDEIIAQHQYMQKANAITFTKNIALDKVIIDSLRLRIILNNLISNAIKYSDDTKENKHISIKTYENNSSVVIEIEDNGIGINSECIGKIFDMFFVSNEKMGSGLGLYIVKEAADCLNGKIEVRSEKNIGTTFTVTLPK